jgi:hypothetical protein
MPTVYKLFLDQLLKIKKTHKGKEIKGVIVSDLSHNEIQKMASRLSKQYICDRLKKPDFKIQKPKPKPKPKPKRKSVKKLKKFYYDELKKHKIKEKYKVRFNMNNPKSKLIDLYNRYIVNKDDNDDEKSEIIIPKPKPKKTKLKKFYFTELKKHKIKEKYKIEFNMNNSKAKLIYLYDKYIVNKDDNDDEKSEDIPDQIIPPFTSIEMDQLMQYQSRFDDWTDEQRKKIRDYVKRTKYIKKTKKFYVSSLKFVQPKYWALSFNMNTPKKELERLYNKYVVDLPSIEQFKHSEDDDTPETILEKKFYYNELIKNKVKEKYNINFDMNSSKSRLSDIYIKYILQRQSKPDKSKPVEKAKFMRLKMKPKLKKFYYNELIKNKVRDIYHITFNMDTPKAKLIELYNKYVVNPPKPKPKRKSGSRWERPPTQIERSVMDKITKDREERELKEKTEFFKNLKSLKKNKRFYHKALNYIRADFNIEFNMNTPKAKLIELYNKYIVHYKPKTEKAKFMRLKKMKPKTVKPKKTKPKSSSLFRSMEYGYDSSDDEEEYKSAPVEFVFDPQMISKATTKPKTREKAKFRYLRWIKAEPKVKIEKNLNKRITNLEKKLYKLESTNYDDKDYFAIAREIERLKRLRQKQAELEFDYEMDAIYRD